MINNTSVLANPIFTRKWTSDWITLIHVYIVETEACCVWLAENVHSFNVEEIKFHPMMYRFWYQPPQTVPDINWPDNRTATEKEDTAILPAAE